MGCLTDVRNALVRAGSCISVVITLNYKEYALLLGSYESSGYSISFPAFGKWANLLCLAWALGGILLTAQPLAKTRIDNPVTEDPGPCMFFQKSRLCFPSPFPETSVSELQQATRGRLRH